MGSVARLRAKKNIQSAGVTTVFEKKQKLKLHTDTPQLPKRGNKSVFGYSPHCDYMSGFPIHPMENRLFEIFALPHLGMCLRACTVSTYICTVCMYFFLMRNENSTYQSRKVLFTCLYTYEFLTFLSIVHMVLFVIMFCALK